MQANSTGRSSMLRSTAKISLSATLERQMSRIPNSAQEKFWWINWLRSKPGRAFSKRIDDHDLGIRFPSRSNWWPRLQWRRIPHPVPLTWKSAQSLSTTPAPAPVSRDSEVAGTRVRAARSCSRCQTASLMTAPSISTRGGSPHLGLATSAAY